MDNFYFPSYFCKKIKFMYVNDNIQYSAADYHRAADIHKVSCDTLLKEIHQLDKSKKEKVLWEVYYLSGYILECIFKTFIIVDLHNDKHRLLTDEELQNAGLITHKLSRLWEKIENRTGRGEFLEWRSDQGKYAKKWIVDFRYKKEPHFDMKNKV
jgi:predicted double-glycine peptidase